MEKVNVNEAPPEELAKLPGPGIVRAYRIVERRAALGRFGRSRI